MRKKSCANCGVQRNIIISAKVTIQSEGFQASCKPLCVPCLLRTIELSSAFAFDKGIYDYKAAMITVDKALEGGRE